jgi:hypothetical protein
MEDADQMPETFDQGLNPGYGLIYLLEDKLITGVSDDRQDGHAVARR